MTAKLLNMSTKQPMSDTDIHSLLEVKRRRPYYAANRGQLWQRIAEGKRRD